MAATTEPIINSPAANNAASQANKKKKAKKTVADNTKYQGIEKVMPIEIRSSHAKGRHAVAAKDLAAGTLVAVEKATTFIVRNQSFVNLCHCCLTPIQLKSQTRPKVDAQGKQIEGQVERINVPPSSCAKCKMAAYCSEGCKKTHAPEHDVQCAALAESNKISATHSVPLEQLRGVLGLIGRRKAEGDGAVEFVTEAQAADAKPTAYGCVSDLNPNRHYIERNDIKNLQTALKEVLALVPEEARIPLSEAVEIACIFHTNNHAITVNSHGILGVFPFSSLYFQHNCNPNCVCIGGPSGVMYVRTLTDVPANGELSISYADLYQPREQRRRELLLSRHFWCKCRRCSTLLSQSVDRFMDGILCGECKKGVMIFEETKEVQDINELMTDISALDQEIQGKFAECESCPSKIEVTKLVEILKAAITDYGAAHMALQQQEGGDLVRVRQLLERFVQNYEEKHVLHPCNAYLVNTYITLVRVCTQLGDVDRAIRYNGIVVDRMRGPADCNHTAVPENYPRLAEYNMTLGDMCLKQAKKKAANKTPAGRSITRRYLKEAKAALDNAYRARVVIHGEKSQRAAEAKRLLDDAKKEYDAFSKATEKKKSKKQPQPQQQQQPQQQEAASA
ncbi:hypothetical protein LPJ72_004993 [Coemansia sp. Benny D160-2]|nr:hypothetical protein LPJ72_004993 [Coemansia sp. Benny D160-2]